LRKVDPSLTQQDIEALQAVAQNMARLELGFSQAFKGQGQVSDFERKIVQSIGPQKTDTARVAALKSELILARGKMDELTAEAYSDWAKQNPSGYVSDFKTKNPEYKKLVRQYNKALENIQRKYGFE
jgi:thiamine pyrophosphate-dependent acetolactate synthase large subunit-like protein